MLQAARQLRRQVLGPAGLLFAGALRAAGRGAASPLLVLGHMRSGSTLLLHLLMTHTEIGGVGERNLPYSTRRDFARLQIQVRLAGRAPLRRLRYVADQLNHNHLLGRPGLQAAPDMRAIFLLREPDGTLASLLHLSRTFYENSWSAKRAIDYYVDRLHGLAELGAALGSSDRALLLRYETLTTQPRPTLEALRIFLRLESGFQPYYATHAFTRTRGDPGERIAAGRILSPAEPGRLALDADQMARAGQAYRDCLQALAGFAPPTHPFSE